MAGNRTLWEEGRYTGRLVGCASATAALLVVLLNLVSAGRIGLFFDLSFVLVCVVAALAIRPAEFFLVGVLPPLLMAGTITVLAVLDRSSVADERDGMVQAVVSGLAHHVTALLIGYALTLAILAVRQVALRNAGKLRASIPAQRTGESRGRTSSPTRTARPRDRARGRRVI